MGTMDDTTISKTSKISLLCAFVSVVGLLLSEVRIKIGQEVLGQIFGLFMFASIPVVILSLIDILKKGDRSKKFSYIALLIGGIISGFFLLLLIFIFTADPTHRLEF